MTVVELLWDQSLIAKQSLSRLQYSYHLSSYFSTHCSCQELQWSSCYEHLDRLSITVHWHCSQCELPAVISDSALLYAQKADFINRDG